MKDLAVRKSALTDAEVAAMLGMGQNHGDVLNGAARHRGLGDVGVQTETETSQEGQRKAEVVCADAACQAALCISVHPENSDPSSERAPSQELRAGRQALHGADVPVPTAEDIAASRVAALQGRADLDGLKNVPEVVGVLLPRLHWGTEDAAGSVAATQATVLDNVHRLITKLVESRAILQLQVRAANAELAKAGLQVPAHTAPCVPAVAKESVAEVAGITSGQGLSTASDPNGIVSLGASSLQAAPVPGAAGSRSLDAANMKRVTAEAMYGEGNVYGTDSKAATLAAEKGSPVSLSVWSGRGLQEPALATGVLDGRGPSTHQAVSSVGGDRDRMRHEVVMGNSAAAFVGVHAAGSMEGVGEGVTAEVAQALQPPDESVPAPRGPQQGEVLAGLEEAQSGGRLESGRDENGALTGVSGRLGSAVGVTQSAHATPYKSPAGLRGSATRSAPATPDKVKRRGWLVGLFGLRRVPTVPPSRNILTAA
jgi:hypothetical protein